MKIFIKKHLHIFLLLFFLFILILSGCSGTTVPSNYTNISGNWTMTNLVTASNNPIHDVGATTTAKCNIVDNSGSLTITNFRIINQEGINWGIGYGSFKNSKITANVNGSYLNIYGQTVTNIIYFEGNINSSGVSGNGTWSQTVSVGGNTWVTSGTTIFVKG